MKKPKILVTGIVSRDGLTDLFAQYDVSYAEQAYTREWVLEHIKEYDGLLLMGMKADQELIDRAEKLQVISVSTVWVLTMWMSAMQLKKGLLFQTPRKVSVYRRRK